MSEDNYKHLYEKYKKKYLELKSKGGSAVEKKAVSKTRSTRTSRPRYSAAEETGEDIDGLSTSSIRVLNSPFDIEIFTNINSIDHPLNFLRSGANLDELDRVDSNLITELTEIRRRNNEISGRNDFEIGNVNHEENIISYFKGLYLSKEPEEQPSSDLINFLFLLITYFVDSLRNQFSQNKISDHSIITYVVNGIKTLSINLLDDTFALLTMMFVDTSVKKHINIKNVYTLALTVAFDMLREERMSKLVEIINDYSPDILCLQEINLKMLPILKNSLNSIGFDRYVKNRNPDTFIHKGIEMDRHQYRCIFYKESQVNQVDGHINNLLTGEINFYKKGLPILIYNNVMFVSVHFYWKLNLSTKNENELINSEKQINGFLIYLTNLASRYRNNFRINKIIIIGDTNNTAYNLRKAISSEELKNRTSIHESDGVTFFTTLNGGNKLDNVIEISLSSTY